MCRWMFKNQLSEERAFRVCWFLGCKYSHRGQFQATSTVPLNAGLARDVYHGLYPPRHSTAYTYTPLLLHAWGNKSWPSEQTSRSRACLSPPQTYSWGRWAHSAVRKAFLEAESGASWAKTGVMTARASFRWAEEGYDWPALSQLLMRF